MNESARGKGESLLAISDDFTGCVAFAGECRSVGVPAAVQPWSRDIPESWLGALVVDTQSRLISTSDAVARVRSTVSAALAAVGPGRLHIFKRFDSGLRGHVGSELAAVADEAGLPCVIVSAAPALGVAVEDGEHRLNGVPVHLTDYGTDPSGSLVSSLPDMLPGPVAQLSLADVRGKRLKGSLTAALNGHSFVVVDGQTTEDLSAVATAVAALDRPLVLAGTYGFGALASTALLDPRRVHPAGALAVVGSMRQASLDQVTHAKNEGAVVVVSGLRSDDVVRLVTKAAAALSAGRDVVLVAHNPDYPNTDAWDPTAASRLAELAAWICRQVTPSAIVLVGGETSARTMEAAGVTRCRVVLEPWPTSALLVAEGGDLDGVLVVTKSGALGPDHWLHEALGLARGLFARHPELEAL